MSGKTRFGDLVRSSGRPEILTLWTKPSKDPSLMKAVKTNRVLTVVQGHPGKKRDVGEIGFHERPHALYFIFPRPLDKKEPEQVIGINYELIEQPPVADPAAPRKRMRSSTSTEWPQKTGKITKRGN